MKYPYTITKLKQLMGKQQTLKAMGNKIAEGRCAELKMVIEILKNLNNA